MDEPILTTIEARILGCLIEKERTTPEYYPLTLNALLAAANQKSNRDPIMYLDETEIQKAVDGLRQKGFLWKKMTAGSRVPKFEHALLEKYKLSPSEVAVLCILLLRGPQTPGEINSRSGRLHAFESLQEVVVTLDGLAEGEDPMVMRLPVQPGKKEARFAHLLCGAQAAEEYADDAQASGGSTYPADGSTVGTETRESLKERIARLEEAVVDLHLQIEHINEAFDRFRSQFE